jgi:hypothetical protein
VASAVRAFVDGRETWSGTATDLLGSLNSVVDERQLDRRSWPKAPNALSGKLTRAAGHLRKVGIHISDKQHPTTRTKILTLTGLK